jgi:hypothetical protein
MLSKYEMFLVLQAKGLAWLFCTKRSAGHTGITETWSFFSQFFYPTSL